MSILLAFVLAQAAPPPGFSSTGAAQLPVASYQTTEALNLFVDSTGSDGNSCTATGTGACLTIQGAINKVPKLLLHPVTITVGAGNFSGGFVDGFTSDNRLNDTPSGTYLQVNGTLTNATVATGSATGTATGGTAGSGATHGTLVDSGASWTTNDLRGKLVAILTGTGNGQFRVIQSNTSTTITIAGTWTAPTSGSTYAVQDWATVINGGVGTPRLSSFNANAATAAGFRVGGSALGSARTTFRWLKFTTANGVDVRTDSTVQLAENAFATSAAPVLLQAGSNVTAVRNAFTIPANQGAYTITVGTKSLTSQNNLYRGASQTGTRAIAGGGCAFQTIWIGDAVENLLDGIRSQNANISGSRFDSMTGACVTANGPGAATPNLIAATLQLDSNSFASCGTAIDVTPGAYVQVSNTSGTGNTTAVKITFGGHAEMASSNTVTGTTEINMDGSASTFSTVRGLTPKAL